MLVPLQCKTEITTKTSRAETITRVTKVMKNVKIFQLDENGVNYRNKCFTSLSLLEKLGMSFDINDYKEVYSLKVEGDNDLAICESMFCKFNMNHPSDFTGHSLSIADLVAVDGKVYFCDRFGFTEVA